LTDYRVTPPAGAYFRENGEYENLVWGSIRRNFYLSNLADSLDRIGLHPEPGLDRDDIRP